MKKDSGKALTRKLTVRLSTDEYSKLVAGFQRTTNRKLSEYVRNILLEKPVTVYTRNQSYDEALAVMIGLKNELKAMGNNLNQAVRKLHTLDNYPDIKTWAKQHEKSKEFFFEKVNEIQQKMIQISEQWSQE